jgi:hypothetical protein
VPVDGAHRRRQLLEFVQGALEITAIDLHQFGIKVFLGPAVNLQKSK